MTARDPALPETAPVSETEEFQVAMTDSVKRDLYGYLRPGEVDHRPPGAEHQLGQYEQGVIALITRSTGEERVTYNVESLVAPKKPDDVFVEDRGLKFSASYRNRAEEQIEYDPRKGLAYFHSHPGWSAYPSSQDLVADKLRLEANHESLRRDRPFAAGIVASKPRRETGEPEWSFRAYEFPRDDEDGDEDDQDEDGDDEPDVTQATAIRILGMHGYEAAREGPYLQKLATAFSARGPAGPGLSTGRVAHDSTLQLWGERGQQRLSGLRVAIVGLGGVGSLLAKQVARLGVGEAVLIDFDHVKEANLNRAYGADPEDARDQRPKVEVARREAERAATAPGFEARAIQGSVIEDTDDEFSALGALLDCDVILNAADPHWVQQILDRVAYAHLIPVVRGGTDLVVDEDSDEVAENAVSTVATAGPGLVCLHCLNVWVTGDLSKGVTRERQPPEDRDDKAGLYARREEGEADDGSEEVRDPSVASTNGLVASLMMERFQALTVGTSTSTFAGRQQYRPATGEMSWLQSQHGNRKVECEDGCGKSSLVALGDYVDLETGKDQFLREDVADAGQ